MRRDNSFISKVWKGIGKGSLYLIYELEEFWEREYSGNFFFLKICLCRRVF